MSRTGTDLCNLWRPRTFEEVVGQDRVLRILRAYVEKGFNTPVIFNGQYGTGKTSLTKILASQYHSQPDRIWEMNHPDVVQINAASKTGVKEVNELLDTVHYFPKLDNAKTYIIDEFHMLSHAAFNAFLEILENLPKHVRFLFATTDQQKIAEPVRSRCMILNLNPVPSSDIYQRLAHIAQKMGWDVPPETIKLISQNSRGSMRDAVKYLSQSRLCESVSDMRSLLEIPEETQIEHLITGIMKCDYSICDVKFDLHPYKILNALIVALNARPDKNVWVPVISTIAESLEWVRFSLDSNVLLGIALSRAIYVYKLGELEVKKVVAIKSIFPDAQEMN